MNTGALKVNKLFASVIINIFLLFMALLAIVPFLYMALTSFRQVYSMVDFNYKLSSFNFNNYKTVFSNFPFGTYFLNSVIVVVCSCALNIIIAAMAGYGFAKKRFKGRNAIFFLFLATMMIPGQVTIIPVFIMFNSIKLLNSYSSLILPTVGAFGVFLMKQFMESLPNELIEAARIDGCGEVRTFLGIVVPLIKSVIISLTIFTFISVWNDFIWPLVVVSSDSRTTLTLGLSTLSGLYKTNYGLVMAGATLTFIVPFVLYIFLQKRFIEGIALSGIKG